MGSEPTTSSKVQNDHVKFQEVTYAEHTQQALLGEFPFPSLRSHVWNQNREAVDTELGVTGPAVSLDTRSLCQGRGRSGLGLPCPQPLLTAAHQAQTPSIEKRLPWEEQMQVFLPQSDRDVPEKTDFCN